MDNNLVKKSSITLTVIYTILLLLQIWFELFESETFVKITVTFLILFVVIGIIYAIRHHHDEEKELKKNNYLN